MRDFAMLAAMCIFIPLAMSDVFIAYLLWAWTSELGPNYYLYGFMSAVHFNLVFAAIALIGLLFGTRRMPSNFSSAQKWLLVFLLHASLCALFAYDPNRFNSKVYGDLVKTLLFCLVMPAFVKERLHVHALLAVLALGLGFHGLVEGAKFIASGGGHKVQGVAASMISDNNLFAVGELMVIPILFYLYQYSEHRLVRFGFLAMFAVTAFSVVGTFSRGGFIGLVTVGLKLVLSSRRKVLSLLAVSAVALVLFQFAPDTWFARIDTINNADQDTSFMGRVTAWKISTVIALHNPFVGGGFHAIQAPQVWATFREAIGFLDFIPTPPPEIIPRAAHSIYFEVLGDTGFIGLFLFLAIWVNSWRTTRWIRQATQGRQELLWVRDLSDMLQVCLLVYAISGAALSMGYFELFYIYVALIAVLKQYIVTQTAPERSLDGALSTASQAPVDAGVFQHPAKA